MAYNTGGIINNKCTTLAATDFLMEYFAQWDNTYDSPMKVVEKDNKKYLQYELIGLNASHITVKKNFVNKTKTLFVTVEGKYKDEVTGFENEINIILNVDYKIYSKVTYAIQDGILTIILHEIISPEPNIDVCEENSSTEPCPWDI